MRDVRATHGVEATRTAHGAGVIGAAYGTVVTVVMRGTMACGRRGAGTKMGVGGDSTAPWAYGTVATGGESVGTTKVVVYGHLQEK